MSVLGERIKKLRGGENEMAFGGVVNFIPVLRWKYRGVPWSLKLQGGFFLKTQKSPAFNRASLSYLSLERFLPVFFILPYLPDNPRAVHKITFAHAVHSISCEDTEPRSFALTNFLFPRCPFC